MNRSLPAPTQNSGDIMQASQQATMQFASAYVAMMLRATAAAWQGLALFSREMSDAAQEQYARNVTAYRAVMDARNAIEAVETQTDFVQDCLDHAVQSSQRAVAGSLKAVKRA